LSNLKREELKRFTESEIIETPQPRPREARLFFSRIFLTRRRVARWSAQVLTQQVDDSSTGKTLEVKAHDEPKWFLFVTVGADGNRGKLQKCLMYVPNYVQICQNP